MTIVIFHERCHISTRDVMSIVEFLNTTIKEDKEIESLFKNKLNIKLNDNEKTYSWSFLHAWRSANG